MANYLFRDPDVIFIHIPKNSGTSMRVALGNKHEVQCFGTIPDDWPDAPRLAVVRAPKARFLSAFGMFKHGLADPEDFYHTPRLPDLTIDRALDILEDPGIPFDRTLRLPEANFKHHIWYQTHPYSCLQCATHILRFETLAEDFRATMRTLGLDRTLPHARKGSAARPTLKMTPAEEARFAALFKDDLALLGYAVDGTPTGPVQSLPTPAPMIYDLWPSLFSSRNIRKQSARKALPKAQVDLALLAETPIAGPPAKTWPGRKPDLVAHFKSLLPEFTGTSYLSFLVAACIVVVRRAEDQHRDHALGLFFRALEAGGTGLLTELNLRWLTSIADTLADHGRDGEERAFGIAAALLANTVKLAESERRMLAPDAPWPPTVLYQGGGPLFDGVIAFGLQKGDLVRNLTGRVEALSDTGGIGGVLLQEVLQRVEREDTVFRRLNSLSGKDKPPQISDRNKRWLTKAIRWLSKP